MVSKYNKLNKDQLVQLLLDKDAQLKELNTRLDRIESRLDNDEHNKFENRLIKIERNGYQLEQYCRRETIEIVGLPDDITDQAELEAKVVQIFNHAGVKVSTRDFHAIHRLRKKTVVIAKCVNRRDTIFAQFFGPKRSFVRSTTTRKRNWEWLAKSISTNRFVLNIDGYSASVTPFIRRIILYAQRFH